MSNIQELPAWLRRGEQLAPTDAGLPQAELITPEELQRRYAQDPALRLVIELADARIQALTVERDYYHARGQQLGTLIEQAQSLITSFDQQQLREP